MSNNFFPKLAINNQVGIPTLGLYSSQGRCVHSVMIGQTHDTDQSKSFGINLAIYTEYDMSTKTRLSVLAIGVKNKISIRSIDLGFGDVVDDGLLYLCELVGNVHINVLNVMFSSFNDLKGNKEDDYITLMEMIILDSYYSNDIKKSYAIMEFLFENNQYEVINDNFKR